MDVIAHQPRSTICNPLSIFRARGSQQTRLVWSEEAPGAAPGRATIFCIILRSSIAEHPFDKWKTAAQNRAEGPCFRRLKIEDCGFQIFEGRAQLQESSIYDPQSPIHLPAPEVQEICMPPCEGGGSRCESSRERHFPMLTML